VTFPSHKGTYILILHLGKPAQLTIGKLGVFDFPAGYYAYVGSAFGAGGLRGRLKHHLVPAKKPHWHIDYLRQGATVLEVWYVASETCYEHQWADALRSMPGAVLPAPRFGASDCRCAAHLIRFPEKPELELFCDQVGIGGEIQLCVEKTDHSAHN
jgi:Uri superfamily endonuclease